MPVPLTAEVPGNFYHKLTPELKSRVHSFKHSIACLQSFISTQTHKLCHSSQNIENGVFEVPVLLQEITKYLVNDKES